MTDAPEFWWQAAKANCNIPLLTSIWEVCSRRDDNCDSKTCERHHRLSTVHRHTCNSASEDSGGHANQKKLALRMASAQV